jgi:VanZ family protein
VAVSAHFWLKKEGRQAMREERCLGILCGIVLIGVLICTLWPFNPFPSNQVSWLPEANGVQFGNHGVVISKTPLLAGATDARNSCSLELLLQPAEIERVYTILNFYTPDNPGQFRVRQYRDGLLVSRNVLDGRNKMKTEKFDVPHAFQGGKLLLLTIASGPNGTNVYLNGRQAQVFPKFTISKSDLSGQIVMGTSAVYYEPWPGEIRGLAIYSKELTPVEVRLHYENWTARGDEPADLEGAIARYSFAEGTGHEIHNAVASGPDLEIPGSFMVPHKALLESPGKEFAADRRYLSDLLLNIVGFVPVGFLVCAYLGATRSRQNAILYAILAGGLLSFVIEVMQAYIPQRVSGTTDIVTNTLGAALGTALARPNLVRIILRRIDSVICCEKLGLRPD